MEQQMETEDRALSVTRFEVIGESGRVFIRRPCEITLSFQDSDRTLKVFVRGGQASPRVHPENQEQSGSPGVPRVARELVERWLVEVEPRVPDSQYYRGERDAYARVKRALDSEAADLATLRQQLEKVTQGMEQYQRLYAAAVEDTALEQGERLTAESEVATLRQQLAAVQKALECYPQEAVSRSCERGVKGCGIYHTAGVERVLREDARKGPR